MAGFNFVQKSSFFQNIGNLYDKACGGTKQDRAFAGNYNKVIKHTEEAEKIYFRVIEYKEKYNGLTLHMLVFYTENKVILTPSLTGNQITVIKQAIKSGKGKGYIKDNKIEILERVIALPERVTPESLFNSKKYYNVWEFLQR